MKRFVAILLVAFMLLLTAGIGLGQEETTSNLEESSTTDATSEQEIAADSGIEDTATEPVLEDTLVETSSDATIAIPELSDAQIVEEAGITPDKTILWSFERISERISLTFTFDKVKKAEKRLRYADARLAEIRVMTAEGNTEAAQKAEEVEQELLSNAESDVDGLEETDGEGVDRVKTQLQKHITVLQAVRAKLAAKGVPTKGIDNALTKSSKVLQKTEAKMALRTQMQEICNEAGITDNKECKTRLREEYKQRVQAVKQKLDAKCEEAGITNDAECKKLLKEQIREKVKNRVKEGQTNNEEEVSEVEESNETEETESSEGSEASETPEQNQGQTS